VTADAHRAIEAVWRIESARLIAGLARIVGDVGLAEDLAQDALVAALEQWPESGVPDNPGAWLMATAKHRAIDQLRRHKMLDRKHAELGYEIAEVQATAPDFDAAIDDHIGDEPWYVPIVAEIRRLGDAEAHHDEPLGRNNQDKLAQATVGEESARRQSGSDRPLHRPGWRKTGPDACRIAIEGARR